MRTPSLFPGEFVTLVVSNEDQYNLYAGTGTDLHIQIADVTGNIAAKRQWILDNLVEEGEWIVMADDNIKGFRAIAEPWYSGPELDDTGILMEKPIEPKRVLDIILECQAEAENRGAKFVGFRTNSNPFFGRKKWNDVSYVSTKICLIKKDSRIRFDPEFPMRDEVQFTAEHLLRNGRTLVNKYMYPVANHYEAGGIGPLDSRLEKRREECRKLMLRYPMLFKFKKNHKSTPPESDLQLRIHSTKQLIEWRNKMFEDMNAHHVLPNQTSLS